MYRSNVSRKCAWLLSAAHLFAVASALSVPTAAIAQADPSGISVPAGDLGPTLRQIGEAYGTTINFDPDAVSGKQSQAVSGAGSARDAVLRAITGLDLAVRVNADGSITVFQVEAAQDGDIVVIARRDEAETNYRVNRTTTSDRSGGTLRELPQSTAVVSDKLIRDQQVQSIDEAMRNVAGASSRPLSQGLGSFSVRGFNVSPVTNGIGETSSGLSTSGVRPIADVERIEILKGPAAILAGQNNLGGTVNVVTKRPTADPLLFLTAEYQSDDSFRGIIDASNALTEDKQLSARIIAQAQHADSAPGGYDGREEYLLSPSLRFKNASTDVVVGLSTSKSHVPTGRASIITIFNNGATPFGEVVDRPDTPIGRRSAGIDVRSTRYYLDAQHTVAPWLTIAARGEHYDSTVSIKPVLPLGEVAYATVASFNSNALDRLSGNSADAFARINFSTGPISHKVVTGFNYTDLDQVHFDADAGFEIIDLLDPNFRVPEASPVSSRFSFSIGYKTAAVYVQDLIEFGPVHLSVAFRKNWYDVDGIVRFGTREVISDEKKTSGVPAFGVVVDVTPEVSIYGNYTRGYNPTTAKAFDGSVLPDINSTNKEIGVKADLFGKQASLVVSVFETKQDNILTADRDHPGFSESVPGGQRGRGLEATLTGRVLPGLNVNATYSYTKYTFADAGSAANAGLQVIEAQPRHTYSLFASYQPAGSKIGGALGVFGRSSSLIQDLDSNFKDTIFELPGGAQVDGNVYVNLGQARLNLGVKNIFDKRLYEPTNGIAYVPIADGRTFTATLSYRFF